MTAALKGTNSERKTIISSRNAPMMTPAMKRKSRERIRSVRSIETAVDPPTATSAVGIGPFAVAFGMVSVRRVRTSAAVAGSIGPVVGVTSMMAAVASLLGMAGVADFTPGVAAMAADSEVRAVCSAEPGVAA